MYSTTNIFKIFYLWRANGISSNPTTTPTLLPHTLALAAEAQTPHSTLTLTITLSGLKLQPHRSHFTETCDVISQKLAGRWRMYTAFADRCAHTGWAPNPHWLKLQSGWFRRSMMWTLGEDSEFGSSVSRGIMLGCKFLSRRVTVAAKFNNKPVETQQ